VSLGILCLPLRIFDAIFNHFRYENRSARFIDGYSKGLDGAQAAWTTESMMDLLRLLIYSREGLDNSTGTIDMYGFCDYFVLKL